MQKHLGQTCVIEINVPQFCEFSVLAKYNSAQQFLVSDSKKKFDSKNRPIFLSHLLKMFLKGTHYFQSGFYLADEKKFGTALLAMSEL
jgi:hypothetical protein